MKIAIDGSKAVNEQAGIARYTWEIANNMPKYFKNDEFFYFFNFLRKSKEKINLIQKLIRKNKNVTYKIIPIPGQLKEKLLPQKFSILNHWLKYYDIYHATEFLSFDNGLKIPQVVTVHDLAIVRFPKHRGEKESSRHSQMLKNACLYSDGIISVSHSTKNDIIKYFRINPDKITVVHSGYNPLFKKVNDPKKEKMIMHRYNINFPFILFVGTVEPRKNIINLMEAFSLFQKNMEVNKCHLVIIGKKGWNTSLIDKAYHDNIHKDKIHFLDYVEDDSLLYFYNKCELFCYPSIFEGFGFPPLEAMACGAPVVTSNISSLPEICGSAAYYIDPEDPKSIFQALSKILNDDGLRRLLRKKSLNQAKKFFWKKCVEETYKVYKGIIKKNEKKLS